MPVFHVPAYYRGTEYGRVDLVIQADSPNEALEKARRGEHNDWENIRIDMSETEEIDASDTSVEDVRTARS